MKYLLVALWIGSGFYARAQFTFKGIVEDENGKPVPSVSIEVSKGLFRTTSDSLGNFVINTSGNIFTLQLSHIGYASKSIHVKDHFPQKIILYFSPETIAEAVVQAFERNTGNKNSAVSVGMISAYHINRVSAETILPAVNNIPGVKMDERSPGSYRLSIRGNLLRSTFGVRNVKMYWNGMPFTDASGVTNLNAIAPSLLSSMEIIKGPSGSMYGAGTGGVVLLKSGISAFPGQNKFSVAATAGSYGLLSVNTQLLLSKKNTTSISLSHQQYGGYRVHSEMKRDALLYTGMYPLGAKRTLNTLFFLSHLFYETPGGLTKAEMDVNPKQARPAAGSFQGAETQKASINLHMAYASIWQEWLITKRIKNITGVFGSYTDFENPTIRNYEDKYDRGAGARTVFLYNRKNFDAVLGAEVQKGFFSASVFGNNTGHKTQLQYRDHIRSLQANVFVQAGYMFKQNLQLLAGLSVNYFTMDYVRKTDNPLIKDLTRFSPQYIPRVSLMKNWKPVSVYATVSKGFSAPSIDEVHAGNDLFNKALQAEKSLNYELGFKARLLQNTLWLQASGYFFKLKNTIVSRRDSSGGDYYLNAGSTRQSGLEATLNFQPVMKAPGLFKTVLISINYSSIKALFVNYQQGFTKYDGNKMTGTVPNVISLNADFVFSNNIYFNSSWSYTGKIPLNDANTVFAASYNLVMTKIGYKCKIVNNDSDIFLSISHSLNRPYGLGNDLNAAGMRYFNPSAPLNVSAGIKMNIGL